MCGTSKRILVLAAIGPTMVACVPVVDNLTARYPVDPALSRVTAGAGSLLVLPVWYDSGPCNVRSAFQIPATDILRIGDRLPSRRRVGMVDIIGHGPGHFRSITGILLISDGGNMLWLEALRYPDPDSPDVYWRSRYAAQLAKSWQGQFIAWLKGRVDGPPPLAELPGLETICKELRAILTESERTIGSEFFQTLTLPEGSPADEKWQGI